MIIVRIWEGIGNQLFQYAYARGRLAQNVLVCLDLNKAYLKKFPTTRNNTPRENSIQHFNLAVPSIDVEQYHPYFFLNQESRLEKGVFALAKKGLWPYVFLEEKSEFYSKRMAGIRGNVYLKGWFQDVRYFEAIRQKLLRELTPRKRIRISSELRKMIQNRGSVAVHVRRGDYIKAGRVLPMAYYARARKIVEQSVDDPLFLIFSDDYEWVKNNIKWGRSAVYVDEVCDLEDYEQLFLMSRCHSQIIANSTFSWWAAWLNQDSEKTVIVPERFVCANPGLQIKGSIVI